MRLTRVSFLTLLLSSSAAHRWSIGALRLSSPSSSSFSSGPPDIRIPAEKLEFSFARSSGPGGQNVNKLNTKAEIRQDPFSTDFYNPLILQNSKRNWLWRFNVQEADWIPEEVKVRLLQQQGNNMNKVGELVISAQEFRTQKQNKELCLTKLREMVEEAYIEPKDRNMWTVHIWSFVFYSFFNDYSVHLIGRFYDV